MRPRTFINTLLQSFSSVEYYLAVLKAPFWFTFRFFLITYFLYGLYAGQQVVTRVTSFITANTDPVIATIIADFPQEGYVFWSGSTLEVSPDPFRVTLPEPLQTLFPGVNTFALLTGNSSEPQALLTENNTSAYLVVANNTLFVRNNDGTWESTAADTTFGTEQVYIDTKGLPGMLETGKTRLYELLPTLEKIVWAASSIYIILVGFGTALINGLIISLLAKIQGIALSYWKSVQLALHLLVPLEGVYLLAQRLYPTTQLPIVTIGFWILLIFFFVTQREELYKHHALKPANTPHKRKH